MGKKKKRFIHIQLLQYNKAISIIIIHNNSSETIKIELLLPKAGSCQCCVVVGIAIKDNRKQAMKLNTPQ
jgi:hypothetical protein